MPCLPAIPLHPTSGTTGQPKIAARPGECALEEARHYIERIDIGRGDVILAAPPMSHAYAYGMCVMVPLLTHATVVCMKSFKTNLAQQALTQFGVSIFPSVPAMLDLLMFGSNGLKMERCRAVLSAGSPLPERTAARFRNAFGRTVRPLYGTTETGGISVGWDDDRDRFAGAVGAAMTGVEVEIRPHSGAVDAGEGAGMLHVRSSSMMAGYVSEAGVDDSPITGGWFATGDLARIDASGEIHLLGRVTEVINVSGMKVIPSEVERVIASLPGVIEVKVYPGRRRSGDQFVQAAIVLEADGDVAALREQCAEHFVYYKRPERMHVIKTMPRSPAGKIRIQELPNSCSHD